MRPLPPAMVLCAGFGSRLQPLTQELPKPLVPLGDRSVLAHVVEGLAQAGVPRVVVNGHHLADCFEAPGVLDLALPAQFSREKEILGTAGGVRQAQAMLGEGMVLVVNGDILVQVDVGALWQAAQRQAAASGSAAWAWLAVTAAQAAEQGSVGIGSRGQIVRLRDGRYGEEVCSADFVGTQLLTPEARAHLPPQGCLVGDLCMPLLAAGRTLQARHVAADFRDIGTPASYLAAHLDWLGSRQAYLGPRVVKPEAIQLDQVVLGADVQLGGAGLLQRVVAWPGARVEAPLRDAIVTRHSVVDLSEAADSPR